MTIDIVFDVACPWCFIGKRRLTAAIKQRSKVKLQLRWRPFLLNPDMPSDNPEQQFYVDRRFGKRAEKMFIATRNAGNSVGIPFMPDSIDHTPATLDAHRLIRFAIGAGCEVDVVEAVMSAYFIEGKDIGDKAVLTNMGVELGLDRLAIEQLLDGNSDIASIYHESIRTHRLGVNGIPCYIFNEAYAVAGAQESEIFIRLLDLAAEMSASALPVSPLCSAW
ncbi:MAG: DsbA family oxidoreductase [Alphaproteobacteria bacterium]|nr:DsbA family oxidoreductase [Alphaproteobacteria bacterium]